ncbi:hypothetical protein BCR35DRAFT_353423 [Leucosporidium creatinivorum]|uniref:CASTOR ACT domain-containing protein n=1 Tax=Leucosporidium creatinivorum TaxID=106004 RepID=A0A1Y2EYT5_9BASI|nr:hypothetical protein BCR35DRAFT_353423 [Leucosporidium creatinivorum]
MASSTTITILEARLRLVRIPRGQLHASMAQILDCWWFRRETDPFFALCLNQLEVSIFADSQVVSRTFGEYMDEPTSSSSDDSSSSSEDDEADDLQDADSACGEDEAALAGTSGITLGQGNFKARRRRDRDRRREERKLEKEEKRRAEEEAGEESIKVGEAVWVALEIAFHGDGWESAGLRVHALSRPLAESGISILFLSTYAADFILVPESALVEVTAILESSGFQFNAADDSDEDESALADSMASLGGLSRRASQRRQRGESSSTTASGSGRPRSNGGSLAGSLTLSDRGSIGGSSGKSSTPSTTVSMSRSASASRVASAAQARRPSSSRQSTLATIGAGDTPSPADPSSHEYTSPTDYSTPLPLPPHTSPRPPPAFTPGTSLTLLPDELVCVGLAQGEPSETLWRTKIVTALFYPERVLPRPDEAGEWDGRSQRKSGRRGESRKGRRHEWEKSQGSTPTATTHLFPHSPSHSPSPSRSSSLRHSHRPNSHSRPRPAAMSRTSTDQSASSHATSSSFPSHLAGSVSTSLSGPPVPFVALTQTADGTSLTADVRLLRALFGAEGAAGGQSEEELVYAVGSGGLRGVWAGEEGESEGEYDVEGADESGYSESEIEMDGVPRSLSRSRGSRGRGGVRSSESESTSASEAEDWEHLEREDSAREKRERREKARQAGEGGRRLLKCLQVDLVAFGLDKHGIVEQIAGILGAVGINCLYQSTYSSANILVSKSDIARARIALEEHGRERNMAA